MLKARTARECAAAESDAAMNMTVKNRDVAIRPDEVDTDAARRFRARRNGEAREVERHAAGGDSDRAAVINGNVAIQEIGARIGDIHRDAAAGNGGASSGIGGSRSGGFERG